MTHSLLKYLFITRFRYIYFTLLLTPLISQAISFPYTDSKPKVIFFLGPDCPISQKYIPTIKGLYSEYKENFNFEFYYPSHFSKREIREFTKGYDLPFTIMLDKQNQLSKKLGATKTPEVYLIRGEVVLYSGAINNWFVSLGKSRLEPTEHYLSDALSSVSNGKAITINKTEAIGCPIGH